MTESVEQELKAEVGRCISCGFCEAVCPTLPPSGFNLWKGARGRVILGGELLRSLTAGESPAAISDSFYSCLDCHACLYVCPAGVNAGKVSQLSRQLISKGPRAWQNPLARMIVSVTMKKLNPLGLRSVSSRWSEGIQFDDESDVLLYTGNMYQLMSYTKKLDTLRRFVGKRASGIFAGAVSRFPALSLAFRLRNDRKAESVFSNSLRSIVLLLRKSGINIGYLGNDEPYPGTFLYDLGYINEFRKYAAMVTGIFRKKGARKIVTVDPHTYELLKYIYPKYVEGFDFDVTYYLDELQHVRFNKTDEEVVFHEPCHFILRDHEYRLPEMLLRRSANVRLASRSGKRNECCGGPNELMFPDLAEKAAKKRHDDLSDTGASTIVTSCPICFANLDRGHSIADIADFLAERIV